MRRNARPRSNDSYFRNLMFWSGTVLLLAVITFGVTYAIYSSKVKSEARVSKLNTRSIGELVPNNNEEEIQSASSAIGRTVNEIIETSTYEEENNITNEIELEKEVNNNEIETTIDEHIEEKQENDSEEKVQKHELNFKTPIEGEILRDFASEKLVYSDTLKEWVTHPGIDIKAIKTSVVKSAEDGIVRTIKNDPRYGITVIVEHENGFRTVYSNLLTAEFVTENEEVKQGQSIGTVGSSANFEIADETHLHFEMWKDEQAVDPELYLK